MKRSGMTSSKVGDLAEALGSKPLAVGILECLWHLCARETPRGNIGKLTDRQIAREVGWMEEPEKLISTLVSLRFLDRSEEYRLLVHDWHDHCDEAVRKSIIRSNLGFASGRPPRPESAVHSEPVGQRPTTAANGGLPLPCLALPLNRVETRVRAREAPVQEDLPQDVRLPVPHPPGWDEAWQAVNEWAASDPDRGVGLVPTRGDSQRLSIAFEGMATGPPIAWRGVPTARLVVVAEAVRRLRGMGTKFGRRNLAYALTCIQGQLDEWRDGVPDDSQPGHGGNSAAARGAAIRGEARRSGKRAEECDESDLTIPIIASRPAGGDPPGDRGRAGETPGALGIASG